eukprot:Gb_33127 [translate_table: standard]
MKCQCWSDSCDVFKLSVEDLGELVGLTMGAEQFDPCRSITIGSSCIWGKFIFLATGRPGDCMEMLLECLRNPGRRLGIAIAMLVILFMAVGSERAKLTCYRDLKVVAMGIHGVEGQWQVME